MSMKQSSEQELDLRRLEPPGPMQKALAGIQRLRSGEVLKIHTRFRPVYLLEQLDGEEYHADSVETEPDHWLTTITRQ